MNVLDWMVDVLFWIDILLSFNTGVYKKGILIMNRQALIIEYLKTWFILDILASFPYSYLISTNTGSDSSSNSLLAKTP